MAKGLLYSLVLAMGFTQALIRPFIYLEYQIRKDYIIEKLCEERFLEINTCDGKCFLVRKLDEAQQRESEEKERSIKPVQINLQLAEINHLLPNTTSSDLKHQKPLFCLDLYQSISRKIDDKPPQRLA